MERARREKADTKRQGTMSVVQVGVSTQSASPSVAIGASRATTRLALLDAARLFAAIGIIWVHAAQSDLGLLLYPIGTFGVPFYICIALLFMTRSLTRQPHLPLARYVGSRFTRVYVPFLAWTAIYVLLAEAKTILSHQTFEVPPWTVMYAGGQQHLWFLPYLMVVSIIGAVLVRLLEHRGTLQRSIAVLLAITGFGICWVPEPAWIATRAAQGDLEFWRFAFRAIPTVCFGLALALGTCMNGRLPRTRTATAIGGMILFAAALFLQHRMGSVKALRAAAGIGIVLVALWPVVVPMIERIGSLGRYSYGIYLSHVVFVRIIVLWTERYNVPNSIWLDLFTFAFALVGALSISILFAKSRYTRWLLGE